MNVKKILVSQQRPAAEKPYLDLEQKYGVQIVFRPFIRIEGLPARVFRLQRINIPDYSGIIFTSKTAVDHFFRLCQEIRYTPPKTLKYFCLNEHIYNYVQKYADFLKRKFFFSKTGRMDDLVNSSLDKIKKEKLLLPMSDVPSSHTNALDDLGIEYTPAQMYKTVNNDFQPDEPMDYDMLIFFSPAGVRSLIQNFPNFNQGDIAIGAMGTTTIEAIHENGLRLDITTSPQFPSIPAAIDNFLAQHAS